MDLISLDKEDAAYRDNYKYWGLSVGGNGGIIYVIDLDFCSKFSYG